MLGMKVGGLLTRYAETVEFYAPSIAFGDAESNLPIIMAKRGIDQEQLRLGMDAVRLLVEELPSEATDPKQAQALQRIGPRDPDDWPIAAAALVLNCPIWTEDKDFFGAGIPTWTTDLVEIYLRNDTPEPITD